MRIQDFLFCGDTTVFSSSHLSFFFLILDDLSFSFESDVFIILSSLFFIKFVVTAVIYSRRKNRIARADYVTLITKLKNKVLVDAANPLSHNVENSLVEVVNDEYNKSSVSISAETEKKLLRKLEAFEASERFLKKDISLTSMSHQKGTNPKYLSKVIRIHKNQSFSGYINSLRIGYIVKKLYEDPKYREYKISYLAEECGYTSPQVFVIAFKKETGFTPSFFIERIKEEVTE